MKLKKTITNNTDGVTEVAKYSSLEEVMDKNRPFNIIYSGVEQESYFQVLYDMGIRNFLMSFHYLQNKHINMEKTYGNLGIKFFIDLFVKVFFHFFINHAVSPFMCSFAL